MSLTNTLLQIYERLFSHYGPQHWWPGGGPFEIMVGAILTQATAWINVEKALSNLKRAKSLSAKALRQISLDELAYLIRPCGYFNVKAAKLKSLATWLEKFGDDLNKVFALDPHELRQELLSVYGIGEETADAIILYAAKKPVFVVDAYTCRILERLTIKPGSGYKAIQNLFHQNLPLDEGLFNEFHALFVRHAKEVCRKKPLCPKCCLKDLCPYPQ